MPYNWGTSQGLHAILLTATRIMNLCLVCHNDMIWVRGEGDYVVLFLAFIDSDFLVG